MTGHVECCGARFFPGERCDACGKTVTRKETTMPNCSIFRHDNLVLTVSHSTTDGYEVLVEVDTDEDAAGVMVSIGTATGDLAEVEL